VEHVSNVLIPRLSHSHHLCTDVGRVFGRAVEYASGIANDNPNQTAIIRLSSDY